MAKALDAPYEAGRGGPWLKVKPVQTLDLVVLAAEWGHGRREGWLSNLHLGARDPDGAIRHAGQDLQGHDRRDAGLADDPAARARGRAATLHRVCAAGAGRRGRLQRPPGEPAVPGGLALRFARIKRYRPDKAAAEADTLATLEAMYRRQTGLDPQPA